MGSETTVIGTPPKTERGKRVFFGFFGRRSMRSVLALVSRSDQRSARISLRRAPVKAATATVQSAQYPSMSKLNYDRSSAAEATARNDPCHASLCLLRRQR